jgi:hypothetical protein
MSTWQRAQLFVIMLDTSAGTEGAAFTGTAVISKTNIVSTNIVLFRFLFFIMNLLCWTTSFIA